MHTALSSVLAPQQGCRGHAEHSLPALSITQQLLSIRKGQHSEKTTLTKTCYSMQPSLEVLHECVTQHSLKHTKSISTAESQYACLCMEKPTGKFSTPSVNGITSATVITGVVRYSFPTM